MVPNAALLRLPFGARKLVRLSRLKDSTRNCEPLRQGISKRFDATMSTCQISGPRDAVALGVAERLAGVGRDRTTFAGSSSS